MAYMQFSHFVIDRATDYMHVSILCGFSKHPKVISTNLTKISYSTCSFILKILIKEIHKCIYSDIIEYKVSQYNYYL